MINQMAMIWEIQLGNQLQRGSEKNHVSRAWG